MIGRRLVAPLAIVGAVAAGGVVGAIVGVPALSGAQESSTTLPPPRPHVVGPDGWKGGGEIAAAAKALNLTTRQLLEKLADGKTTIADVAQQQHVDIDTVIDAMVGADRKRIEDAVNNPLPKFGGGPGFRMHGGIKFARPMALDAAAQALHMTHKELFSALASGKTIAQIAKDKSIDLDTVVDAMVAEANDRIDQAQANGRLTKEQAAAAKAKVKDGITNFVNDGLPTPPPGWPKDGYGHGGPRGLHDGIGFPPPDLPSA